jgi:hypothetical protein
MSFFSFYKVREQEGRTGPFLRYQWEEEKVGKWCRKVDMVKILCRHVFKWTK